MSLATATSSLSILNGETIHKPKFCDQFKQFGEKGIFGLYCEENDQEQVMKKEKTDNNVEER